MKKFNINDDWGLYVANYYKSLMVDTLLITPYWFPYNNPGAIRWLKFGEYMDFNVLTSKVPGRGFYDSTIPHTDKYTIRFGRRLPAFVWGIMAIFRTPLNYKTYIISSPPESLLLLAFLLQLIGKNVVVDVRDSIGRKKQSLKIFTPIYRMLYSKIKKVGVAWKLIDKSKEVIYHGYENVGNPKFNCYFSDKINYKDYYMLLAKGMVPNFSDKQSGYVSSSYHTIKRAGLPINIKLADEEYGVYSWEYGARQWKSLINK